MRVEELDTPVLTVDLDAVERNIARAQAYCDGHGIALRPHVKTHKSVALARMQMEAGAAGIACQKLGEAEVMTAAGVDDVLVPYPLVGKAKAARFAALAASHRLSVGADSAAVARGLSAALVEAGAEAGFLVDVDTGMGRTGVDTPEEAADLAELVARLPGLAFRGLMTYPSTAAGAGRLRAAREAVERRGLAVEVVSGGGTPGIWSQHEPGLITELRVGTYVFGDRRCLADGVLPLEDCALRIRATVVSRPTRARAILDAGSKTLTSDPHDGGGHGLVVEYPDARIVRLSEEHATVHVDEGLDGLEIGETVSIVPNHVCPTLNLADGFAVHRGGEVAGTWPVDARGRSR